MKTLLYKQLKLVCHPMTPVFCLFGVMVLIPNYPYSVTFFYVTLGLFFTFLKNLKLLFFFLWYNDRESRWRVELAEKLQRLRGAACPPQVWNVPETDYFKFYIFQVV